jgi:hypothetical protein
MAYITKHTLNKLCSSLDLDFKTSELDFKSVVFSDTQVFYLLNSKQNVFLFTYASLLKDSESFRANYFQFLKAKEDRLLYVRDDSGKYKYHLKLDCPMLSNNFKDFIVPKPIRDKGKTAVDEYRNWFKENSFAELFSTNTISLDEIRQEINAKYCEKYLIKELGIETELYHNIPNTGNLSIDENFDFNQFQMELNVLISQLDQNFTDFDWRTFSKLSSLVNKDDAELREVLTERYSSIKLIERYSLKELRRKLEIANSIKLKIINSLKKYLCWHYNFDSISFNSKTLDDFGLECCKYCLKETVG